MARKGLNSLVILTAWSIWKLRNRSIFDGCQPRTQLVLQEVAEQATLWKMAGAEVLGELLQRGECVVVQFFKGVIVTKPQPWIRHVIGLFLSINTTTRSSPACSRKKKRQVCWFGKARKESLLFVSNENRTLQ
jgi:hypothetical protein